RGVGCKGRGGVSRRSAGDRGDVLAFAPHLFHHADENRHTEVLEGPCVAVPALFDPEVVQSPATAELFGPEKVAPPFASGDDVFIADVRADKFFLAPDTGTVGPGRPHKTAVENLLPLVGRSHTQRLQIVYDLEQVAALRTRVNDFIQGMIAGTRVDAAEPGAVAGIGIGVFHVYSHGMCLCVILETCRGTCQLFTGNAAIT